AVIVNHAWWRERGFRSFLGVPVVLQDTLLAVLALNGREPFELSRDDSELLESFAAQAAIALSNARVYREARQYGERLRALEEVNRTVSSSLQMDEVLRSIAGAVARFFDAPQVSIWVFDPATSRLRLSLSFGDLRIADELTQELGLGEGLVGWAVQHREPVLWTDLEHDMRAIDSPRMLRRGFRYCTAYPIAIGDRVLGGFAMWRAEPSVVNFETLSLLGSLAAQAAVALDHARLFAETAQRLEQSRALLGVTEILSSTLDSTPLLKRVTIKIAQVCGVDRCSLELWDGDRGRPLMSQFADGRPRPELWKAFRQSESGAPRVVPAHLQAIETHRPVVIDDTAATDLIPQEWVHTFGLKSYMVVPLIRQGTVIGVMNLDHCERVTPFAAWQADLALAIAGHLALALENARLYGEARERLRETTTLLAVGHALSQPAPIDQRLRAVAREVGRIFGADMVGVYVVDDARTVLSPITGYHVPRRLVRTFVERPFVLARMPELFDDWRQGRPVWSTDVKNDARFDRETFESLDSHAMLCAPTRVRGESVGAIFLVWWQPGRQVQPAEIRLLEGVAQQVGLAMENAELVRQTERRLHETETLLSVSRELSSTLDVQTLLRHFLRSVARALGAETVGVWMLDDDGETLLPHSAYRVPPEHLETLRHIRLSLHEGLGEEAARTKRPIASEDFAADARVPESIRAAVPVRSQILVPIVARERLIGAFTASWWTHPRRFTADELALLEAIATQAGVAVENARLFEANRRQVEELSALHDLSRAVTGQLDRAALLDAVGQRVCQILEVDTMTLLLVSEGNDDFEVALRLRDGMRDETVPMRYPVSAGLMSAVLREGHAIRTARYQAECARRGVAPVERVSGMPHWLGVPLVAGDRVLGVLAVSSRHRPFSATDERLLTNIGGLVALALRSARLFEERTRALDELAAAQDQLVRTEKLRALGEMASGVAHDFNNLLSAILGRAQLLLGRVEEPSLRRWLQVIERSAQDGAQTVRRLQEFTRIRRDAPMVEVDLNDVVRDALEMTQSRWREEALRHGVSLEVRSALAPLPPVAGDPAELREAMTNLILNAVDAMPGGGRLTITSAVVDGDIEVAVADNGVGMSDEVRQRIFDPFFTTKGPQGTGLGLSMTYGILSRHGARVTVDSERDRGTIFRLRFTPRAARGTVPGEPPAPGGGRGPLRCLVVDDEEAVGQVIGDVLETIGHGVVVMTDGRAAIERFGAERFDVVFTDLAMPGVSGWDVARAVKAAAPEVTVFLVSGFGVELSEEERRSHGVDAVFAKPLKIEQIMDAMARVRLRGGLRHSSEGRSAPLPNPPPES
ncbi:MAG: GAF domain-containing protein, partial [Candidatus Rokubacteria bacterium]|nr:GAF domain-containing protein [Candidatus Rokubacteria bacterium]